MLILLEIMYLLVCLTGVPVCVSGGSSWTSFIMMDAQGFQAQQAYSSALPLKWRMTNIALESSPPPHTVTQIYTHSYDTETHVPCKHKFANNPSFFYCHSNKYTRKHFRSTQTEYSRARVPVCVHICVFKWNADRQEQS